jgi:hypothetical protein
MKKKFLLVCLLALVVGSARVFADHADNKVGIGLFFGGGSGTVGGGIYDPGMTLKIPKAPLFWGVNAFFGTTSGLGLSMDYYLFDRDLIKDGSFDLDWFFGVGAFTHIFFGQNDFFALGVRFPIGLSWHINKTFELFLNGTPGVGVKFEPSPLYWVGGGELGLRVWV